MTTAIHDKIALTPAQFDDVDAFSDWEVGLGWDIESIQLSAGAMQIGFDHFDLPGMLVGHMHCGQSMQNVFAVPDGYVVFIIHRAKLPALWCGRHIPPTLMPILRPPHEHFVVLPAGWDCYEFMVSEELIREIDLFPPEFFGQTMQLERAVMPLVEPVAGQYLRRLDGFFEQVRRADNAVEAAVQRIELYDAVLDGLQQVVDAGMRAIGKHRPRLARRYDLVKRGRDFVTAHANSNASTEGLARQLGASYRVLNYAFRDVVGVSPYQYIITQRLHAARRMLRDDGTSVLDAAVEAGFTTPSRFARQYQRLFGELPSATRAQGTGEAA